jgi:hypothetical protein
MQLQTVLLIAAVLVILGQWLYISWVGNNTDSLAKVIRKQADVIHSGQVVLQQYADNLNKLKRYNDELNAGLLQCLREISAADWDFPGMEEIKKLVSYESR